MSAWLLIQIADTIFPLFGLSETATRIVVIILAIGLIPVLIFSWTFEFTAEGLKKEKEIDHTAPISPHTGNKLDRLIMVVLVLALGYFAFDKFVLSESREASIAESARREGRSAALIDSYGDKSIAVMPFVDLSPRGDQQYFSDGISEELLNLLVKIPGLRVISRSSSFSFRDSDLDIPAIAEQLQVAHILEGSVRKAGQQIRITAQLIDAHTDTQLWSESFDRTLENIFAIQDEIAAEVVEQLKLTLLGNVPRARQTDPEAFTLFLQARYYLDQFTPESLEKSAEIYQQALVLAPDYPPALKGLAEVYANLAAMGFLPFEETIDLSRELVSKAVELDPLYADAYSGLGSLSQYFDDDFVAAARHFEKAVELGPTQASIIGDAGVFALYLGRVGQAIKLFEYQVSLDPVSSTAHTQLARAYDAAGMLVEAVAAYQTALSLSPGRVTVNFLLGIALLQIGDLDEALQSMKQEGFPALQLYGLALVHFALGQVAESDAVLEEIISSQTLDATLDIAAVYAFRKETEAAFDWLKQAEDNNDSGLASIAVNPIFTSLHDDPRWQNLLERLGYSQAQLASIRFDVQIPE